MLGRGHGRGDGEIEALVGERLRAIVAGTAAGRGWVPEPVAASYSAISRADNVKSQPVESQPVESQPVEAQPVEAQPGVGHPAAQVDAGRSGAQLGRGRHREGARWVERVRWDPGRPAAAALCGAVVIAALVAAVLTWWSRPQPSDVDSAGRQPAAAAGAPTLARPVDATGAGPAPRTSQAGAAADQLVVSVIGQVRQPGLVTVANGARVAEAIAAAGGALPDADLSTVNLARLVVDGEQIAVGVAGSSMPEGDGSNGTSEGLVNLNTASPAQLEELPGIGPVLAARIVDFRETNGGFDAVEELREISGIGPAVFDDIVALVTV